MSLSLRLITPPAVEPVSLAQAKLQLKVDDSADDALIGAYVIAARQYIETKINRAIFNQTWKLSLDQFPSHNYAEGTALTTTRPSQLEYRFWVGYEIKLPKPSCVSVTSITYLDGTGTRQTLDPSLYAVDTVAEPARVVPAAGLYWPYMVQYIPGSVEVIYVAGTYGDGVTVNTCPQTIVVAMLLLISHWYEHRDASSKDNLKNIPLGVDELLSGEEFFGGCYENN